MKKALLVVLLGTPFYYLLIKLFLLKDVIDPIKYIYTITGFSSLILLVLTISLSLIKRYINLIKYRRVLGIACFFYALLHFINFFFLDAQLSISFIIKESFDKPFIFLGLFSFLILIFMALTSFDSLYKKYIKFHKLVYIAVTLLTIHFIMAQKSISFLELILVAITLILGFLKLIQEIVKRGNV